MSSDKLDKLTLAELKDELKQQTKHLSDIEQKKLLEGDEEKLRKAIRGLGLFTPKTQVFQLIASGHKSFFIPLSLITVDVRLLLGVDNSAMFDELKNQGIYNPATKEFKDPTNGKKFLWNDNKLMLINVFLSTLSVLFYTGKLKPYTKQIAKLFMAGACLKMTGREARFDSSAQSIAKKITPDLFIQFLGRGIDDELKNQGINTYYFRLPIDKARALHNVLQNDVVNTNFTPQMTILLKKYTQVYQENLRRQFALTEFTKPHTDIPYIKIDLGTITEKHIHGKIGSDLMEDNF